MVIIITIIIIIKSIKKKQGKQAKTKTGKCRCVQKTGFTHALTEIVRYIICTVILGFSWQGVHIVDSSLKNITVYLHLFKGLGKAASYFVFVGAK